MEGYQEDGNKMISIKLNSTEDESMTNVQLTRQFKQTLLEFDVSAKKDIMPHIRRPRSLEQTDINKFKLHLM